MTVNKSPHIVYQLVDDLLSSLSLGSSIHPIHLSCSASSACLFHYIDTGWQILNVIERYTGNLGVTPIIRCSSSSSSSSMFYQQQHEAFFKGVRRQGGGGLDATQRLSLSLEPIITLITLEKRSSCPAFSWTLDSLYLSQCWAWSWSEAHRIEFESKISLSIALSIHCHCLLLSACLSFSRIDGDLSLSLEPLVSPSKGISQSFYFHFYAENGLDPRTGYWG